MSYDTTNLWLSIDKAGNFDVSKSLQSLSGITEHKKEDGSVFVSGTLGNNYKVSISGQGISLRGSLAKYFLPDNFHTLTRSDSARAIEKMSDELYLPISDANVNRIDFAQNFIMDYKPEAYYPFLGESLHYNRLLQSNSLYYSNRLRQKLFYNKILEGKSKGLIIPEVLDEQNILRFEFRLTSRLPKQLNRPEITAKTLSDEKFYMILFNMWHSEFEQINKLNSINFNLSEMKSPKDFWRQIELFAINAIGQDKIMQEVENLRARNAFDKPEYYSRLKKEIKELGKTPDLTIKSDLIEELEKKIRNSKRYYR